MEATILLGDDIGTSLGIHSDIPCEPEGIWEVGSLSGLSIFTGPIETSEMYLEIS